MSETRVNIGALLRGLLTFLKAQHGIQGLACDEELLPQLGSSLVENAQRYSLSVWMDKEIIRVHAGQGTGLYGIALDVGTTTLALYLCSLETGKILASASATNPQTIFGEDIMSRIFYSVHHPGEGVKRCREN